MIDPQFRSRLERLFSRFIHDPVFHRLFRNAATVLTGNVGASGLNFVSTAICARALGPEHFGILATVRAYSNVMKDFADSRCVLPLIKYAAEAQTAGSEGDFLKLIKLGAVIDLGTALFGGGLTIFGVPFAGRWLHWDQSTMYLAKLYSLVLFCNMTNTPTMILRITDKYRTFASISISASLATLVAISIGALAHAALGTYLMVWIGTEMLVSLLLIGFAGRAVGWHRLTVAARIPFRDTWKSAKGFWSFLASVNVTSIVRLATSELDTLLVGASLGNTSAGLYKVIKQVAQISQKLIDPLFQVVYPGLANSWAQRALTRFKSMLALAVGYGASCAALVFLVILLAGGPAIRLTFGSAFLPALRPMRWFLGATVIGAATHTMDRSLLIMGHPSMSLALLAIGTTVYFAAFYPLAGHSQMLGVSLDFLLFHIVWATCVLIGLRHGLRSAPSLTGIAA